MKRELAASALITSDAEAIYAFLAEYRNHRLLASRRIALLELSEGGDGLMRGVMLLRGPLLIRRRVNTRLIAAVQPALLSGAARLGNRTRAVITWELEAHEPGSTHVRLAANVVAAAPWDRLILRLGGRRWIQTLFTQSIERLASQVAMNPPDGHVPSPAQTIMMAVE